MRRDPQSELLWLLLRLLLRLLWVQQVLGVAASSLPGLLSSSARVQMAG